MRRLHISGALALMTLIASGELPPAQALAQTDVSPAELSAHSSEFRKEVIHVTDGVYFAVGYAASKGMTASS